MNERSNELERRWRLTGAVEDESAWLRERARSGELDPARLRLAALLGHDAARAALGVDAPDVPDGPVDLCEALVDHEREAAQRALIATGRALYGRPVPTSPSGPLETSIEAAARWLRCPCERHRAHAARMSRHALRSSGEAEWDRAPRFAPLVGYAAAELVEDREVIFPTWVETEGYRSTPESWQDPDPGSRLYRDGAWGLYFATICDPTLPVLDIVRDALVPWALGYGDPLDDSP